VVQSIRTRWIRGSGAISDDRVIPKSRLLRGERCRDHFFFPRSPLSGISNGGLQGGNVGGAPVKPGAPIRRYKYQPSWDISSRAFHTFGYGASIELSASRKYASYAPPKTISGKYQNSNGISDSYLCNSYTEN
jgi:hypothetical protein